MYSSQLGSVSMAGYRSVVVVFSVVLRTVSGSAVEYQRISSVPSMLPFVIVPLELPLDELLLAPRMLATSAVSDDPTH